MEVVHEITQASNFTERLRITSSGYLKHTGLRAEVIIQNKLAILAYPLMILMNKMLYYTSQKMKDNMNPVLWWRTSAYNAVTKIRFLTSAAVDGTTGTERIRIDEGKKDDCNW
ncbi:MAG: hypothetical protein CM15mV142_340 [Caudoviricetes sp.]|nr:MAG: hypothetical protein CM15mV142_340 [Caudoviricetes sp.]